MIKAFEGSQQKLSGREYGMGISVTFRPGETVQTEFPHIKEALVNWHCSRGDACRDLMMAFTADAALHQEIIDYVTSVALQDEFLNRFCAKMRKLQFCVLTPDGKSERLFEVRPKGTS
jgi:hypothetical protein